MNKFAQSNLGRGPRRGSVAHVRRKSPFVVTVRLKGIRIRSAFLPQCTGQSDTRTDACTDRQTDRSSTGKFDCATTATRPNNKSAQSNLGTGPRRGGVAHGAGYGQHA